MTDPTLNTPAAEAGTFVPGDTLSPADRYQELFVAVQLGGVFADSKTFVDCAPRAEPETILHNYRQRCTDADFQLAAFVKAHFSPPRLHQNNYISVPGQPLGEHIDALWDVLTRHPHEHPEKSSLLPLPYPYVVAGGRFRELYYWDSYFTMLGLAESGRTDLLDAMAKNFVYLIDTYGHIPNGNRTYYLSRSQPPVFALMVELFEDHGLNDAIAYLPQLHKEYAWWMEGADDLGPGEVHRHCVRLDDGTLLNRYWDDRDSPREESYLEDVTTARHSSRPIHEVYRSLRAGAASGWDFSSRWCDDGKLATIRTEKILPVDLNCFLYKLEQQIALLSAAAQQPGPAQVFQARAAARRVAIDQVLWNDPAGAYLDYDWERRQPRAALNAATSVALFARVASEQQAAKVCAALRTRLLQEGGLGTSETKSTEQWDKPNGWAPLQWLAISGLRHYGHDDLADEISKRWLHTVSSLYERESKLVEKYVLTHQSEEDGAVGGSGGEYPLQDGFGWTNGVTRRLLREHPDHHANRTLADAANK